MGVTGSLTVGLRRLGLADFPEASGTLVSILSAKAGCGTIHVRPPGSPRKCMLLKLNSPVLEEGAGESRLDLGLHHPALPLPPVPLTLLPLTLLALPRLLGVGGRLDLLGAPLLNLPPLLLLQAQQRGLGLEEIVFFRFFEN